MLRLLGDVSMMFFLCVLIYLYMLHRLTTTAHLHSNVILEFKQTPMLETPSPWVTKHAALIKSGGRVLDLACGSGRNAIWLAQQGYQVDAIDRDALAVASMTNINNIRHPSKA